MYQLSVREEFVAQHFLTVPDCGPENIKHSHVYALELHLSGNRLNEHGYLVDIDVVKREMGAIIDRYKDQTLNDKPEFKGLNPSIEHFSRIVGDRLKNALPSKGLSSLTVRIWEDRHCWASYSAPLSQES